ncbi:MAG TPA: FAD-binding protein [Gemmatimonadaceae bacterium]|nr:FAD-binding protein [Gemmatimonadaceae bacterium]
MTATSLMSLAPSSVATAVQEVVYDSIESATPLRISGRSHWITAGRPVSAEKILALAAHSGVVDYVPGDLTITLKAGTPLRELERITAEQGQWFPLDPYGDDDGTIGATIATGSSGPLAHSFGRARDLVLGVEFVAGDGRIVRGGGRVVKNVAGFDLTRMVTGSWGTIGVVTEVTLRLYSLPPHPVSLALTVPGSPAGLAQRLKSLLALPINPFAVELIDSEVAGLTGLPCRKTILVALGGNRAAVAAQTDAINSLGGMSEIFPEVWRRLRIVDDVPAGNQPYDRPAPNIVFRASVLPARVSEAWSAFEKVMAEIPDGRMHASPGLGIVRCILPPSAGFEAVHSLTQAVRRVTIVGERMPRELWPLISPTVVGDRVSQGIKHAFDPHNILNPGILGR